MTYSNRDFLHLGIFLVVVISEVTLISYLAHNRSLEQQEATQEMSAHNKSHYQQVPLVGRDKKYLWTYRQNFSGFIDRESTYPGGRDFYLKTNFQGLRGEKLDKNQNKSFRILVIGDSYTFGPSVNRSKIYTNLLEDKLEKKMEENVEVINGGVSSWGMREYYYFLKQKGFDYETDIAVISFGLNDALSAKRNKEFQQKAKEKVRNIQNQKQKVRRLRIRMKKKFWKRFRFNESEMPDYMKRIEEVSDGRTELLFYHHRPIMEIEEENNLMSRYRKLVESPVIPPPDHENSRLSPENPHYNEKGHELVARTLYREIDLP